jgi:N-acetylmuramoyl-L-alanine amidase
LLLAAVLLGFILSVPPPAAAEDDPEERYLEARKNFLALDKSPQRRQRASWQPLMEQFKQLYKSYPDSPTGEKSMFMVGRIYLNLYQWTGAAGDLDQAVDHFTRFINHYPQSPLADDAQYKLAEIQYRYTKNPERARELTRELLARYPQGDMRKKAEELMALTLKEGRAEPAGPVPPAETNNDVPPPQDPKGPAPAAGEPGLLPQVTGMRLWTTPDYTRIVVDVGEKISFRQRLLKKDPAIEKPQRLYLDLFPARLGREAKDPITIQDGLLRSARAGQYDLSTVRIVLDIESIKGYKVFSLENPFRIIIDVTGKDKGKGEKGDKAGLTAAEAPAKDLKLSLAQQLGLGVRRIVIDAGHGGKDKGASGEGPVHEKDLTLLLAKKLAQRLKQELKVEAILTRDSDRFLPLEERTAIANTRQADLFVSIHVNASPNPLAQGFETYFLNLATDEESIRVAARENATSTKRIGDMQKILKDLMLNTKIDESSRLAHQVQNHLVETMNGKFGPVKNLGIKQAPFYVLIGAQMPSILVEASFISNAQERERLLQEDYQDQIVEGILRGIERYVRETKLGGEFPKGIPEKIARKTKDNN